MIGTQWWQTRSRTFSYVAVYFGCVLLSAKERVSLRVGGQSGKPCITQFTLRRQLRNSTMNYLLSYIITGTGIQYMIHQIQQYTALREYIQVI